MKGRTQQTLMYIAGCITFLSLPMLLAPDFPQSLNIVKSIPTQRTLIAYLLMVIFFFVNYFVLIPKLYFPKKYLAFSVFTLLFFLAVAFIPSLIIPNGKPNIKPPPEKEIISQNDFQKKPPPFKNPASLPPNRNQPNGPGENTALFITQHLFIFLAVAFFSLILRISNRWKQAEKEKLNAELFYLRAQINPHFLFNTLNSIYSLAIEKADNTAVAVVKLSQMMRYVLNETDKDFVLLEKEITYVSSYVELQRIRFGNTIPLSFTVTGNTAGKKIAPLILIPFIENAFKHGVNAEENQDIKITITIKEKELQLHVINNKVHAQNFEEEKSGLGIENTKERLRLLYPEAYNLAIDDKEKYFSVLLTMQLI
ncbi:MAG TPA: sensor histidine kinase [Panacibacter sp.]|nr:sensor histidine kinase [Panacibacter sp.]